MTCRTPSLRRGPSECVLYEKDLLKVSYTKRTFWRSCRRRGPAERLLCKRVSYTKRTFWRSSIPRGTSEGLLGEKSLRNDFYTRRTFLIPYDVDLLMVVPIRPDLIFSRWTRPLLILSRRRKLHLIFSRRRRPHLVFSRGRRPHLAFSRRRRPHLSFSKRRKHHLVFFRRRRPHLCFSIRRRSLHSPEEDQIFSLVRRSSADLHFMKKTFYKFFCKENILQNLL